MKSLKPIKKLWRRQGKTNKLPGSSKEGEGLKETINRAWGGVDTTKDLCFNLETRCTDDLCHFEEG